MRIYVATTNRGKLAEMRAIFAASELELDTYAGYVAADENELTYGGNALAKVRALQAQLRAAGVRGAVLADDSGIEVAALGGRPGIFSARYAGESATWPQRRAKLLEELVAVPNDGRAAKFCCAMELLLDEGERVSGYGEVEGVVTTREHGVGGFGYDPIFFYPPADCTFAELAEEAKNAVSHRRRAADALITAYRACQTKR